jgi:hypothetical protein
MDREDEIRLIAYTIWEDEGCCDGSDVAHWVRAEAIWQEKQAKAPAPVSKVKTTPKSPVKPGARKTPAKRKKTAPRKKP